MEDQEETCPPPMNGAFQHVMFFLFVTFSSGALFGWSVVEENIAAAGLAGKKYQGYGFLVCLFFFAFSGFLLHIKLLSLFLRKLSFQTIIYLSAFLYELALFLVIVGAYWLPEMLFISEILIAFTGALIYVQGFCLFPNFKAHAVLIIISFSLSSLMFEVTLIPIPIWGSMLLWMLVFGAVTVFYHPKTCKDMSCSESSWENIKKCLLQINLYPTYITILVSIASKTFYQQTYWSRISELGYITNSNLQLVYTFSMVSCFVSGFLNFARLEIGHMIWCALTIVYQILAIVSNNIYVIGVNLFIMNIAGTGIISTALSLNTQNSDLFESNSLSYLAMAFGNVLGVSVGLGLKEDYHKADIPMMMICMIVVIVTVIWEGIMWRNNIKCNPPIEESNDMQSKPKESNEIDSEKKSSEEKVSSEENAADSDSNSDSEVEKIDVKDEI